MISRVLYIDMTAVCGIALYILDVLIAVVVEIN